jgi:ABC-2 type transport system permease protein
MKVATWPWLLRHEMRLAWRGFGGMRLWFAIIFGGLLWVGLHFLAWGLLKALHGATLPAWATLVFGGLTWLILTMMFSQAIALSVGALFERGDFDLLLASPMSARTVFIVRGLGIALSSVTLYLYLLSPFAHMGVVTGNANLLAIYPALLALGLLVSALAMLLTLTLVRLLGARRARVVAQLIAAVVGAVLFLISQTANMLGHETRDRLMVFFKQAQEAGGVLAPDSMIWFPFRALFGESPAFLLVMLAGVGGFGLVVNLTYHRFLAGTQESVTGIPRKRPVLAAGSVRFKAGLTRNMLVKEWKLIARDPGLITQTLMQLLYMLPLMFLLFRGKLAANMVVPAVIMLASILAGSLAWITVAAEDAPELIGVAPVDMGRIRALKALAALLPVWLLVTPILFYLLAKLQWELAAIFIFCLLGATLSAGVMQIGYPRKGDRKNMKKRGQSNIVVQLFEGLSALAWGGVAYCLVAAPWFAPLPLALALLGPGAAWVMGASRRRDGLLA